MGSRGGGDNGGTEIFLTFVVGGAAQINSENIKNTGQSKGKFVVLKWGCVKCLALLLFSAVIALIIFHQRPLMIEVHLLLQFVIVFWSGHFADNKSSASQNMQILWKSSFLFLLNSITKVLKKV